MAGTIKATKKPRLQGFVFMPELRCNAACSFCAQRLERHHGARNDPKLSLEQWRDLVRQGIALGLSRIIVSGGEPTLYPNIVPLVRFCKEHDLKVTLNTNGIDIQEELARSLADAGLDNCMVSLYSHDPNVHDELKGVPGAYQGAMKTIDLLRKYRIPICFLTVLTNKNLAGLSDYLEFIRPMRPGSLYFSYLEGDNPELRPSTDEILHFHSAVLPRCVKALEALLPTERSLNLFERLLQFCCYPVSKKLLRKHKLRPLRKLYQFKHVSIDDLARGIYNPSSYRGCGIGNKLCLILANGDVLPCFGVQYRNTPPVGNVHNTPIAEIWYGEPWERARKRGSGWCKLCPMGHHVNISLAAAS